MNIVKMYQVHIQYSPQTVAKPIGQEALLHCNVVANPNKDLSFVWLFNGNAIDAGNVREIKVRDTVD